MYDDEEFAFYNVDRGENASGSYHGNFRFYDKVFNTEEEAEDFFNSLGSYCDGVVMVKEAGKAAQNRYSKKVTQRGSHPCFFSFNLARERRQLRKATRTRK